MVPSGKVKNVILALSISILLYGMYLILSREFLIGCLMALFSSFCIYYFYLRERRIGVEEPSTGGGNIFNVLLGFLLILIDITYNLVVGDNFGSFDKGMMLCGIGIVLLNTNVLNILKLDPFFINFASKFLFIFMLFYGFLFSGVQNLTGNGTENYLLSYLTILSGTVATFFLNLIGPTTIHIVPDPYSQGVSINFRGFGVGIFWPCSGAESLTVFLAAAVAYLFSNRNIKAKKMLLYIVVGVIALFFINVLRVILLVLIGYGWGDTAMRFFHYNLGWIFFIMGMAVFWFLVMREDEGELS